ncbi:hypothetical protein AZE42_07885 [Rhizopogon vesiculosus]|uniref:Uncharacterized protein n=1 Tax=Rhizopogon vesiculosus TaxID=180088 RepID=A0A1J8R3T2_9AGAM|nr:hypothetical protein AZE42_07885 [Rhizopogon vesiculosus]
MSWQDSPASTMVVESLLARGIELCEYGTCKREHYWESHSRDTRTVFSVAVSPDDKRIQAEGVRSTSEARRPSEFGVLLP